jgi:hypothetical protein
MLDTNVETGSEFKHSLWIDAPGQSWERSLAGIPQSISYASASSSAWTPDPRNPERFHIVQRVEQRRHEPYDNVVVVVDNSAGMKSHAAQIAGGVEAAVRKGMADILMASDLSSPKMLPGSQFRGGIDNVPALLRAQRMAAERGRAAVLWLHGAQDTVLSDPEPLRNFWKRRPGAAPLYALPVVPGRHVIVNRLNGAPEFQSLRGPVDLVAGRLTSGGTETVLVRERVPAARNREGHRTSAHLARLWAFDEVLRLASAGADGRQQALELAREFQLVTPVSGAVVLETKAQYDAAGLKPVATSTVPTVPEPETWALLGVALAVIVIAVHRRRRACRA